MSDIVDTDFPTEIPDEEFKPSTPKQLDQEAKHHMNSFTELLNTIDIDEKLKLLWRQVYQNAVTDRKNAIMVWADLYMRVHGNEEKHVLHGERITKYMERIEKANLQLIKLTELVQKAKIRTDEDAIPKGNNLFELLESQQKKS